MRLALPLVLSSLSRTLLTFIDRMFLLWWSENALAASFPAALLWWCSLCFPLGTCMYASTFVSQYFGARQERWIGPCVWQGVWIAVGATPLVTLLVPFAPSLFEAAQHGPGVIQDEVAYFRVLCVGTAAMLVSYAMSAFYSGQGKTWVVMVVDAVATLANIVLDYVWIFGHMGFPAMGIEGAAWATVVALWLKVAIYLVIILRKPNRQRFHSHEYRVNRRLLGRLLYFGGPSGLQMFLEIFGFTIFVFLVGSLGVTELTATNLAFNVSSVAFMPVFGLATAASILVGQYLGQQNPDLAGRSTWTTAVLALLYMGVVSSLYVLVPDLFLFGFFAGQQSGTNTEIRDLSIVLLRYVAAYNLFDALNLVFAHAIKGAGDTHFVFLVSLGMAVVLGLGTFLVLGWGLHACWAFVTVWVWLLGVLYLARFVHGRWRSMSVIERESTVATRELSV